MSISSPKADHALELDVITYEGRRVISINGVPFYESSGESSSAQTLWFPFLGIIDNNSDPFEKIGWMRKPHECYAETDLFDKTNKDHELFTQVTNKLNELLSIKQAQNLNNRFFSISGMLISSLLGGDEWNSSKMKAFKEFLIEKFPEFYKDAPKIIFKDSDLVFNKKLSEIKQANEWLCKKAAVAQYSDLDFLIPNAEIKSTQLSDGKNASTPTNCLPCSGIGHDFEHSDHQNSIPAESMPSQRLQDSSLSHRARSPDMSSPGPSTRTDMTSLFNVPRRKIRSASQKSTGEQMPPNKPKP